VKFQEGEYQALTEQLYDALWAFTKEHKDYTGDKNEPQPLAILSLFNEQADASLRLRTAADVEEACQCIRMSLKFSF
jgi:hypothetical protein